MAPASPKKIELSGFGKIHSFLDYTINTNKYLVGLSMILLNVGSKFITIQFSKSTEEYLKMTITKQILVFSMCFLGTRCVITSLMLTAAFTILSDYVFNEESHYCVIPPKYRVLNKMGVADEKVVTFEEIEQVMAILDKLKREKQKQKDMDLLSKFN